MNFVWFFLLLITTLLTSSIWTVPVNAHSGDVLGAYTSNAPTIDGVINEATQEWGSAATVTFDIPEGDATIYVMNDRRFLYIAAKVSDNSLDEIVNVGLDIFGKALEKVVESFARVEGGNQFLSQKANASIIKAAEFAKKMGDEFVSIEHLLLGILSSSDDTSQMLKDNGVTEGDLTKAIGELRKGSKVTSQTSEETYNSLAKYEIRRASCRERV